MGNFYTNITLQDSDAQAVAAEMEALNRESYVFSNGYICVVYDKESESQDTSILAALAETLATKRNTVAFAVLNHDDDVLWFQLYRRSELLTEYSSTGGPATNIRKLVDALGGSALRVWWLLKRPFVFQIHRHQALNRIFRFPEASLLGYTYVHRGERTDDMNEATMLLQTRGGGR